MERMPNIVLTSLELNRLLKYHKLGGGGEAIICFSPNPHTAYKIFTKPKSTIVTDMSLNKLKKLERLYQMQLKNSVQPISTITLGKRLIGYEMTYDPNNISVATKNLERQRIIEMLKQSKSILEYYASLDITYGDIRSGNILVNRVTNEVSFCDIDNMRIGEYGVDFPEEHLQLYGDSHGSIDASADSYMHNLFTLSQLGFPTKNALYDDVIESLQSGFKPSNFKRGVNPILESMIEKENFTGEYIISHIKR